MVTTWNELKLKILTRMEREKKKRKRKGLHYSAQYIWIIYVDAPKDNKRITGNYINF